MTEQFDRDIYCLKCAGFVVIPRFMDTQTVDRIAALGTIFEEEVERFVKAGGKVILRHNWPLRTTRCLFAVSAECQDLALDPTIQKLVQNYLGPAVVRDCIIQTNMPDDRNAQRGLGGDVSFHRDTLWPDGPIRPMYLHVFLLLTEFTRANGSTMVVPGTHLVREPAYYFKDSDLRSPQPGIDYRAYEQRYFPSAIHLEAPKGSLILLDPMTIHTQGINITKTPRSLLNIAFRSTATKGAPPLLNARAIAEQFSRVPVRTDFLDLLECDPALPAHFGPLGNSWPPPASGCP